MPETTRAPQVVVVGLAVWLLAAVVVGATGLTAQLQPPAPQLILVVLTVLCLTALWFVAPVRRWASTVDLRVFVAFHLTRFVGVYFLVLYRQGELPFAFAVPGGWGDIIVAGLAVGLLTTGPPTGLRRRGYLLWNMIGLVDIIFVVATAARLALADPQSMAPLLQLPLSLLVTFVVPIIIASHVWLFRRLRATNSPLEAA